MTPETALCDTVRFTAARSALVAETSSFDPWLVTGTVLMAQQALASGSPANNPRSPTEAEIVSLYKEMW